MSGEKNKDGTRTINKKIDLGKNGYFIIYSQDGIELRHPTVEGQNAWNFTDKSNKSFLLVQDQVRKAKNKEEDAYTYYTWNLPNSD